MRSEIKLEIVYQETSRGLRVLEVVQGDVSAPRTTTSLENFQCLPYFSGFSDCSCSCASPILAEHHFFHSAYPHYIVLDIKFNHRSMITPDLFQCYCRSVCASIKNRPCVLSVLLFPETVKENSGFLFNFHALVEWYQRHEFLKCAVPLASNIT